MKIYTIPNCQNPYLQGEFESINELQSRALDCGLNKKFIDNNIVEIDTDTESYILKDIPKEFHSALSYYAYEKGHAYGDSEIRLHLRELVDALKKPIQEFESNLRDSLS